MAASGMEILLKSLGVNTAEIQALVAAAPAFVNDVRSRVIHIETMLTEISQQQYRNNQMLSLLMERFDVEFPEVTKELGNDTTGNFDPARVGRDSGNNHSDTATL